MSGEIIPMQSSNEWLQQYHHQPTFHGQTINPSSTLSHDAITVTTDVIGAEKMSSRSNSHNTGSRLSPNGCVTKPIRRRSRASKKTPVTLLNANAGNFRALVQRFTGCSSSAISFGSGKGPVNLNFGLHSQQNGLLPAAAAAASAMSSFGIVDSNYQQARALDQKELVDHLQEYHQNQRTCTQEENGMFPLHNYNSNTPTVNLHSLDEFLLEDTSLHGLIGDA